MVRIVLAIIVVLCLVYFIRRQLSNEHMWSYVPIRYYNQGTSSIGWHLSNYPIGTYDPNLIPSEITRGYLN